MRLTMLLLCLFLVSVPLGGCVKEEDAASVEGNKGSTPATRLHQAAKNGELDVVRMLMARGCTVDTRDENGYTPLHTAAVHDQSKVVEFLISQGADVNAETDKGLVPLGLAKSVEVAKLLIASGAEIRPHVLYGYSWSVHPDVVNLLLDHGAQIIPGDTPANKDLLCFAVRNRLPGLVEKLLAGGANPNVIDVLTGLSVLTQAVLNGGEEVVSLLVAHGADVNGRDGQAMTPLCYVTDENRDVAELLLARGADVHCGKDTPLHLAVMRSDKGIVELFLRHGADVNALDARGNTPLDEALARGFADVAEILRRYGGVEGRKAE